MPTTTECNAIIAAFKELGGSATTAEIAAHLNMKKEIITRYIQSMRKFGMVQVRCTFDRCSYLYELKTKERA